MQQTHLRFNPEQLSQTYTNLQLKETTPYYSDYICKRNTNNYDYLARKLKTNQIDNVRFAKLRRIKLYNILPVLDLYREEKTLVSQDFEQFSLLNNIADMPLEEKNYVASFVSITLQELIFRNIPFRVNPKTIIIIGTHVCLQQIDFEFDHIVTPDESFKSFIELTKFMDIPCKQNTFADATNFYLEQQDIIVGPCENMPFADFLEKVFDFKNCDALVDDRCNSFVFQFDTPDFLKTIPGLSNKTVLKSTKIDNPDADRDYLIVCAQRELQIMENFKKYEPFVSCFAYFRIQEQLYLFMELYPLDLDQALQKLYFYERNIKELCCQLAVAIRHLHRYNIIHRDLKPQNLFLSHDDLDRAQILIADFDHSTQLDEKDGSTMKESTGLTATSGYEPPESGRNDYDHKADIWQIGMIFYQIANGEYPINCDTYCFTEQQYRVDCSYEKIKEKLQDKEIDEAFVKVIAACLSFKSQDRPNADQLLQLLEECFGDLGIEDEETLQSTHQINMVESYGQLIQRSKPLRLMRSSNI